MFQYEIVAILGMGGVLGGPGLLHAAASHPLMPSPHHFGSPLGESEFSSHRGGERLPEAASEWRGSASQTAFPRESVFVAFQSSKEQEAPASSPAKKPDAAASQPASRKPSEGASPDAKGSGKEGEDKKESEGKKEGDGKSSEKGKPETPAIILRPQKPEEPADPRELDVRPDAQGRVRFNFSRQSWPAILEWLANISKLSLDWQELPGDTLNLQTQRDYSLEEARDLINHHLLARGFTLLKSGELLTVVNLSKLNPAMVPRVEPEELKGRMNSEFVRVSFPLKWMLAERAAEELKPMLSQNGKLFPLKETNRIEAIDTVGNLRDIDHLLRQSQSEETTQATVVREFRLEHRRAAEVVLLVESILGIENKRLPMPMGRGGGGDMMSFQIINQLQQMQQMMQQGQRNQGNQAAKEGPEPRLIVNDHENSILAHATPDKLEIIAQTIKAIDVPGDEGNQLLQSINRVKPYRLSTADPQPIMALLKEMGNLSPQSRLQVDEKSKSLILYGTLADHYTTQSLIERLDGTNRNFEVIPLRRLQADAVAGTIQYLLGAEDEDKNKNQNNRYSYWGGYGNQSSSKDKEDRPFRVDADLVNNRLLLWANDVELEEVRKLLAKMGEISSGQTNPETLRSVELSSPEEARKLLEQLKQVWPEVDQHPLRIQISPESPAPPAREKAPPQTRLPVSPSTVGSRELLNSTDGLSQKKGDIRLPWWEAERSAHEQIPFEVVSFKTVPVKTVADPSLNADQPPFTNRLPDVMEVPAGSLESSAPVTIQQLPDGKLIYQSPDPRALDRLEDLINQLVPPQRDYHVFQLKYPTTWAYGIELILEDFFEDKSLTESHFDPWWGTTHTTKTSRSSRLSRQKELKIISNDDSHTILVQGATTEQLKVIQDLIDIYDRPTSSDPQALRKTEIFQLQYSKAAVIAEAVKQVYRDLLSANDPALQNPNQQKPSEEPKFTYIYGRGNSGDEKEENPGQPIRFKGLLSVGVDEVSNTVIVSSTESLMVDIRTLVTQLDLAARPQHAVQVMQVKNIAPELIQQRLERTFSGPVIRSSSTSQHGQKNPNGENAGNREGNSPRKGDAATAPASE